MAVISGEPASGYGTGPARAILGRVDGLARLRQGVKGVVSAAGAGTAAATAAATTASASSTSRSGIVAGSSLLWLAFLLRHCAWPSSWRILVGALIRECGTYASYEYELHDARSLSVHILKYEYRYR